MWGRPDQFQYGVNGADPAEIRPTVETLLRGHIGCIRKGLDRVR
jgi:hypothetical protein